MEVRSVSPPLRSIRDPGSLYRIDFVEVELEEGAEPRALEHEEVAWLEPAEVRELELAPADEDFVRAAPPRG